MRRAWLAPIALVVALVIQLTVLDGLHLPRGGVPDLVLVLVVALAIVGGPVPGMVTGFAAGLCADIAPPGSPLIGQYALVFCLAGWAAGSLGRFTKRSPLRALGVAAVVIAGAEALAAGIGKVLEPDQVSVAEIRRFLPATIAYDLVLCPFALYLVILTMTTMAGRSQASALAGTGQLAVHARSQHTRLRPRPHMPRLDPAAARAGDGWVSGGSGRHPGSKPRSRRGTRFHPGAGLAGSASGYARPTRLPARPVKLELPAARHGDAVIGDIVGNGHGRQWQTGRHPGMMAGAGLQIRFAGDLGGSAWRQHEPAAPRQKPVRIDFRGLLGGSARRQHGPAAPRQKPVRIDFRGLLGGSAARQQPLVGPRQRPLRINFGATGGGSTVIGNGSFAQPTRAGAATFRPRVAANRSALAMKSRVPVRSVPTVHFRTSTAPIAHRPVTTPKFRRKDSQRLSAPTTALVTGGALNGTPFRANRMNVGRSRLRLAGRGRGRGLGMLGGGGLSTVRRPPARARKQPRFSYGRRSLLRFLTGRGMGGQWLARRRAGHRSGAMLIGKRTGRLR